MNVKKKKKKTCSLRFHLHSYLKINLKIKSRDRNRTCLHPKFRIQGKSITTPRPLLQPPLAFLAATKGTMNATEAAASTTGSAVTVSTIALPEMTRVPAVSVAKQPLLVSYGLAVLPVTSPFLPMIHALTLMSCVVTIYPNMY